MLSWVVSLVALVAVKADSGQSDLSPKELEVWQRLQKGFATLHIGGVPGGTAALIDASGLFLAHRTAVASPIIPGEVVEGTLSSGRNMRFTVITQDSLTRLVLMQAEAWRGEYGNPIRVPEGDETGHGMVFAVLPAGPIRAAFTKLNRPGFVQAERRVIPLNEVQFEAPAEGCAGALLVDEDGELLGVLNATLSKEGVMDLPGQSLARPQLAPGGIGGFGGGGMGAGRAGPSYAGAGGMERILHGKARVGPSDLMVAYTAGVVVLKRVVEGFRSPDHRVAYPSIGLLCKDTPTGGALVQAVQPESPADRSGIQPGDVLLTIAGVQIRNQVDFALVMLRQTPGDTIAVQFRRRNKQLIQRVVVGHS